MKFELKVVHNGLIAKRFADWSSQDRINGYTTLLVHRSYGSDRGPFVQDVVSGEKYMTFLYFKADQEKSAKDLKKELEDQGFFAVLSNLEC